jgi:hypothetical protein
MPHLNVNLRDLQETNAAPQRKSARSAGNNAAPQRKSARSAGNNAAYGGEQMNRQDRL